MRRVLSWALLLVFLAQSSAAPALAASADASPGFALGLRTLLNPLLAVVDDARAFVTIGTNQAALDQMRNAIRPHIRPNDRKAIAPVIRIGRPAEHLPADPPPPRVAPKDPRAMRGLEPTRHGVLLRGSAERRSPSESRSSESGRMRADATTAATTAATDTGAGISKWWRYEEAPIPGVGQSMVNVGTGNLVITASDVDIPEPGIDLAFHRVYNSQSLHDYNADDGSQPAIYGEKWTNNYDAYTVYRPGTPNIMSVYDIDGTRCDYSGNKDGTWTPCAGEHAILEPESITNACVYYWVKPSGTYYIFHSASNLSVSGASCGIAAGNVGRLYQIVGRNSNNYVTINASWDGTGKQSSENITQLLVKHSDGDTLTLNFGLVGSQNELATIVLPDGHTLRYLYDVGGNLAQVDKPGNNMYTPNQATLSAQGVPAGDLPEAYSYGTQITACGPRAIVNSWEVPAGDAPADGSCILYQMNSSNQATMRYDFGIFNPIITDAVATGALLQPSMTAQEGWVPGRTTSIAYNSTGATRLVDSDGHQNAWVLNSALGVSQTWEWTGAKWLTTYTNYDANNNLVSSIDPNSNETDYSYDANGNTLEVALPKVSTSVGSVRPTRLFSYDASNNLIAYCDANRTNALGLNAGAGALPATGTNACPSTQGSVRYKWSTALDTSYEPYGELTDTYTAKSYHRAITYATAQQGGTDLGLPTLIQGDPITQADGSSRAPEQTFVYDAFGDLTGYGEGEGKWNLTYDADHRPLVTTDPAGYASYKCYYLDGSVEYTENAAQHADDNSPTCNEGTLQAPAFADHYAYDSDGDETSETHHYGHLKGTSESLPAGTTTKFYDGMDRLVEVEQPLDPDHDFFGFPWVTRYFYDIGNGSTGPDAVNVGGTSGATGLNAYGGLYKTTECLPVNPLVSVTNLGAQGVPPPGSGTSACTFEDVRGTAYDGLDRVTAQYEMATSTTAPTLTNVWDGSGQLGYLVSTTNGMSQATNMAYDSDGRMTTKSFPAATAKSRTYGYDPDGHQTSVASTQWGTEAQTYDADGNRLSVTEPPSQADPGTTTYAYYPDDLREGLSLSIALSSGSTLNLPNVMQYDYRIDGMLATQQVNNNGSSAFASGAYSWTYDAAGRELTQRDPSTGQSFTATLLAPSGGGDTTYPVTYVPKTTGYDPYGRVNSLTLPNGTVFNGYTYDDADEPLAYAIVPPSSAGYNNGTLNVTNSFTIRGELGGVTHYPQTGSVWSTAATPATPCETGASGCTLFPQNAGFTACTPAGAVCAGFDAYANGTDITSVYTPGAKSSGVNTSFDSRSGQILGQSAPDCSPASGPSCYSPAIYDDIRTLSYDLAGRQTQTTALSCKIAFNTPLQPFPAPQPTVDPAGSIETRTYDAENHIQGRTVTVPTGDYPCPHEDNSIYTMAWGLDGHPWQYTATQGATSSAAMHWDGDTLLYTSSPNSGSMADSVTLYIGKLGVEDISPVEFTIPYGITTYDRDSSGSTLQMHDDSYFSSLQPATGNPSTMAVGITKYSIRGTCTVLFKDSVGCLLGTGGMAAPTNPTTVQTTSVATIDMQHDDGYQVGDVTIQGVRAYDPFTSQWTSPDAYKGDVHDPMSQKPYMWNSNNPIAYADPSGYDSIFMDARQVPHTPFAHIFIAVYDDKGKVVKTYSFGPKDDNKPFGSQLVSKQYSEDSPTGATIFGGTQIGGCKGVCTTANGGFSESSLQSSADSINRGSFSYEPFQNSNSAAYTLCAAAGGQNCGSTNTGGHLAPGDGNNLFDGGKHDTVSAKPTIRVKN